MSDATKAVFLSYASQDAEAARRICDALRAAGVEVWFDQSELTGGDVWDAKIRGQVASCALFVPIVSANTQARLEGYFRIEWKLAAQRTHAMADEKAFLLPVVIDETHDAEAKVPVEFKAVQWTRLPGGEMPEKFCARVKMLLSREVAPVSDRRFETVPQPNAGQRPALLPKQSSRAWLVPAISSVAVIVAVTLWQPWKKTAAPNSVQPVKLEAPQSEARKLTAQARALIDDDPLATRENLKLAEDLAQKAVALDLTDGEAAAVHARVSLAFITGRYEVSPERLQSARSHAERAVRLLPDSVETVLALAGYFNQAGQFEEAERGLRAVLPRATADQRLLRSVAQSLIGQRRFGESTQLLLQSAALPGGDARALTIEAERLFWDLRIAEADALLERALAQTPTKETYEMKLRLLLWGWGDLAAAHTLLAQMPAQLLLEDIFAVYAATVWRRSNEPDRALEVLRRLPREFREDSMVSAPKSFYAAFTLWPIGRTAAAEVETRQALGLLEKRLAAEPNRTEWVHWKASALALLGRKAEAEQQFTLYAELGGKLGRGRALRKLFILGDREGAVAEAQRSIAVRDSDGLFTLNDLRQEPLYAPLREDARIQAVLAEGEAWLAELRGAAKPAAPAAMADAKSVAVLAFENLSGDKDNEYFSDGISDELLNLLGKIPGLRVAGRTSAFSFKGKNVAEAEIAQKLGVAYIVNGTVQKSGTQVRITARLTKAADGFQIWSDKFTRELQDIFAVQDEIAGLIAQNLSLKLGGAAREARVVNPEAYRLVLEGRHFWLLRNEEGFARAEASFTKALEIDPQFAQAHAGLADVWSIRAWYRLLGGEAQADDELARAATAARLAQKLDPNLPEAYAALGAVFFNQHRYAEAEQQYLAALRLNPNYSFALHWYAQLFSNRGRVDEQMVKMEDAVRADPLSFITLASSAIFHTWAGRYEEALALSDRALALRSDPFIPALGQRALILHRLGREDEALAAARKVLVNLALQPRWWMDAECIAVLRKSGFKEEAEAHGARLLATLSADSPLRGFVLAALGRPHEALQQLAASGAPSTLPGAIFYSDLWEEARRDPLLPEVLDRLGFTADYKLARETVARLQRERAAPK